MEVLDPCEAEEMKKLLRIKSEKSASFSVLHAISPSLHEGLAIIYHCRSGKHKDRLNRPHSWTPMCVLGLFEEGAIDLEELGLRIHYQPGDFVSIRGREVTHNVEHWKGKLRISLVYYTHDSLWKEAGLK
jgi:hypothetical protein